MTQYYVLDEQKKVVPTDDVMEWGTCFEDKDRCRVALSEEGDISVSTVFLGLDHQYGDGPLLIFETMIFGGENDEAQWRCSTWEEAVAQHLVACDVAGITAHGEPGEESEA